MKGGKERRDDYGQSPPSSLPDNTSLLAKERKTSVTQVASMAGDTSADNEAGGHGETPAPKPYVMSNAEGPLDRDEPRPLGHFGRVPGLNLGCLNDAEPSPSAMTRLAWRAGDRRGSGRCGTRRQHCDYH
jgi:hypothetical protein